MVSQNEVCQNQDHDTSRAGAHSVKFSDSVSTVPKPDGLGTKSTKKRRRRLARRYKPTLPPAAFGELGKLVRNLNAEVAKHAELSRAAKKDPKGFRADLVHLIVKAYPLKRGRPTDPLIDEACELLGHGKTVPTVLRKQIRDWQKLDAYTRYLAAKGLRQAARRRKSGLRNRQPKHPPVMQSNA